jgi:putative oxidoreductase
MDTIALVGRVLFCSIFLSSAWNHLTNSAMLAGYSKSKGVPAPRLMVIVTGFMLLVGGVSVLLGAWPRAGAALLVLFLLPTAFIMHNFWTQTDPLARGNDRAHFQKDLSLAGAALMVFAFGTGAYSLMP